MVVHHWRTAICSNYYQSWHEIQHSTCTRQDLMQQPQSWFAGHPRSCRHVVAVIMLQHFFNLLAPLQRVALLIFEVVRSIRLHARVHRNKQQHSNFNDNSSENTMQSFNTIQRRLRTVRYIHENSNDCLGDATENNNTRNCHITSKINTPYKQSIQKPRRVKSNW